MDLPIQCTVAVFMEIFQQTHCKDVIDAVLAKDRFLSPAYVAAFFGSTKFTFSGIDTEYALPLATDYVIRAWKHGGWTEQEKVKDYVDVLVECVDDLGSGENRRSLHVGKIYCRRLLYHILQEWHNITVPLQDVSCLVWLSAIQFDDVESLGMLFICLPLRDCWTEWIQRKVNETMLPQLRPLIMAFVNLDRDKVQELLFSSAVRELVREAFDLPSTKIRYYKAV